MSRSIELLQQERQKLETAITAASKEIDSLERQKQQCIANIEKWRKQVNELDADIITLDNLESEEYQTTH